VFFDSAEPLVAQGAGAQDANGGFGVAEYENVFEWEREGAAGCPPRVPARLNGGCVYLISDGANTSDSVFLDASASGDDVFFASRERLIPQALTDHMKLYDARVGGGFPAPVQAAGCVGEGCRSGASSPSVLGAPGSATFSGAGNLAPHAPPAARKNTKKKKLVRCSRGRRLSHGRCVKRARAKRSSYNRRGK
jgi:hypothetical protein